jgi:hypothetical protein
MMEATDVTDYFTHLTKFNFAKIQNFFSETKNKNVAFSDPDIKYQGSLTEGDGLVQLTSLCMVYPG